eukprot:4483363-Amphidinium_carterae.1
MAESYSQNSFSAKDFTVFMLQAACVTAVVSDTAELKTVIQSLLLVVKCMIAMIATACNESQHFACPLRTSAYVAQQKGSCQLCDQAKSTLVLVDNQNRPPNFIRCSGGNVWWAPWQMGI